MNRPWGLFGAGHGGTGRFVKLSEGNQVPLPTKPANLAVRPDEAVVVETPGAGGYGPPVERERAAVENDFRSGKFSREYVEKNYGYTPGAMPGKVEAGFPSGIATKEKP